VTDYVVIRTNKNPMRIRCIERNGSMALSFACTHFPISFWHDTLEGPLEAYIGLVGDRSILQGHDSGRKWGLYTAEAVLTLNTLTSN
jgi:hypothetical protein